MNCHHSGKKIWISVFLVLCVVGFAKRKHIKSLLREQKIPIREIFLADISTTKSYRAKSTHKVHLVSYAGGTEVNFRNQNALAYTAINKGFDVIHLYNEQHLDKDFKKRNQHILKQARGAGYWLWKPYVILDTLKHADDGDIIVYMDSGCFVNRTVDSILEKFRQQKSDVLLIANGHTNKEYIKRDLMKFFDMDTEECRNKNQINASFLMIRNTTKAREFIAEWLAICEKNELITDKPSVVKEYSDFKENRHDQAILTLVSYKHPDLVTVVSEDEFMKDFRIHHRRRERHKHVSLFDNVINHSVFQ